MHGKAAASPRSGATWASEYVARHQRDQADAKRLWTRDTSHRERGNLAAPRPGVAGFHLRPVRQMLRSNVQQEQSALPVSVAAGL